MSWLLKRKQKEVSEAIKDLDILTEKSKRESGY